MSDPLPKWTLSLGLLLFVACARQPSQEALEKAARDAYAADHMWCVQQYATAAEIDACRAAVRRRWGTPDRDMPRDAGRDGAR